MLKMKLEAATRHGGRPRKKNEWEYSLLACDIRGQRIGTKSSREDNINKDDLVSGMIISKYIKAQTPNRKLTRNGVDPKKRNLKTDNWVEMGKWKNNCVAVVYSTGGTNRKVWNLKHVVCGNWYEVWEITMHAEGAVQCRRAGLTNHERTRVV